MKQKDRVIEGKKERQRTMDKMSLKSGRAYTYDKEKGGGSGCLSKAKTAREETQRKLDR